MQATAPATAAPGRFLSRASLSTRLGLLAALAILIAVGVLVEVMVGAAHDDMEARLQASLETNLRLGQELLRLKGAPRREGDKLIFGGYVANGDFDVVDRVKTIAGGTATLFMGDQRVSTNVTKPDGTRAVGTQLARGPAYDSVFGKGETYRGKARILDRNFYTIYDPIKDASGATIGVFYVGVPESDFFAAVERLHQGAILGGVVITIIVSGGIALLFRRSLRPLRRLVTVTERLKEGDLEVEVPVTRDRGEIGAMAVAVRSFRDSLRAAREITLADQAARAERQRRQEESLTLSRDFARRLDTIVASIAGAALQVKGGSTELTRAAEETSGRSAKMVDAARSTNEEVRHAAAASVEMSERVSVISSRIVDAKSIAHRAVERAGATADTVRGLAEAARRIDAVIGLINNIASRTNLLALNATIEASRAGEAGRGFNVVASEVKSLANQTATATGDIRVQIESIQSETARAVDAIEEIMKIINDFFGITVEIAGAMDQQGSQTRAITRDMSESARGTTELSDYSVAVSHTARATGDAAGEMLVAATEMASQADALRGEVGGFIGAIAAPVESQSARAA